MEERLYIVAYDIADQKRWRKVYKLMQGYGEWLQLSLFQCQLSRKRHAEMIAELDEIIHHKEDHIITLDLGLANNIKLKIASLGKEYQMIKRGAIIV